MNLKDSAKHTLGFIRCKLNHIKVSRSSRIYIGKDVNIIGGGHIALDKDVTIRPHVDLWCCGMEIKIGEGSEIGERCRISIAHELTIGEKVLLSPNVYITDCDHEYRDIDIPVIDQGIVQKPNRVEIKDGAYIGINSVIVGNVTIGKGSVIGAGSVVTKDIPDYCVAVGSPAKVIKEFNRETLNWEMVGS